MTPTWNQRIVLAIAGLVCVLGVHSQLSGQTEDSVDLKALQADYDMKLDRWRATIKQIRAVGIQYMDSQDASSAKDIRKEWNALREKGRAQLEELIVAAQKLYVQLKRPSAELTEFLAKVQARKLKDGFPDVAYDLGQMVLKHVPKNKDIQFTTAKAAIQTDRFDEAKKFAQTYGTMIQGDKSAACRFLFPVLPELQKKFDREKKLRAAEAELENPLPQVTIETNRGQIVVELFEDQAPNAAANFIKLVEAGSYDGMVFHRVLKDFMAQTGNQYANGKFFSVDYTLYDECKEDDARYHFRGSLSMAKAPQPDSSNTQFFICNRALPHLDGIHTVFGRVVSGWDTLNRLTHTHRYNDKDEEEAIEGAIRDYIISAKVTRKRDHEYEFQKIPRN